MLNHRLQVASGLDCNMESLISDLRHQYSMAAAASSMVSQAMLFQAISNNQHQSRSSLDVAPPVSSQSSNLRDVPTIQISNASHTSQSAPSQRGDRMTLIQCAPLDLSVKQTRQATATAGKSRSTGQRRQALPFDLVKSVTQVVQERSSNRELDLNNNNNNNNNNNHSEQQPLKLISSSTSPSTDDESRNRISASLTRTSSSSSSCLEVGVEQATGLASAATDVISSTNGRRTRRKPVKKQKGPKSHLCNHCGRSFSRSDMLTRHSRLHSGHKPYQCAKCFQVFSRSDHLSTHERTHTGEKPYQCGICAYSACRRDMITRHMRTHLGQRVKSKNRSRKASLPTSTTNKAIGYDERKSTRREPRLGRERAISTDCDDGNEEEERNGDFII